MILRDNTTYYSTAENLEQYLSLQNVANRRISELLDENGNDLLIYPHSFSQCEDETGKQVLLSMQTSWKERQCTKVILETGNMAGFIEVNGQSVSIHSRFAKDAGEDLFLHYMLHKILCINVVDMPHGTEEERIFDFLQYLFPGFLNEALSQGMYKEYQQNEYNDANVRGMIEVGRHIRTNMPFYGRIAYRVREFSHDNHVTELIRHTIEYISKTRYGLALLENNEETHASVARIIAATPRYDKNERERIIRSNLRIVCHPYYSRYVPLQKLCLRILKHEGIKYGKKNDKIHGILFDVAYLWEEYLATIIAGRGFKHPNNKKRTGRIHLAKGSMFPRYPDFHREHDRIVIDAKYKREINRDDIHQMIAYMYRMKGQAGFFIQPGAGNWRNESHELLGYGAENSAKLHTYFHNIPQIANDYGQFVAGMMMSEDTLKSQFTFK